MRRRRAAAVAIQFKRIRQNLLSTINAFELAQSTPLGDKIIAGRFGRRVLA
jgi:hypothetical protein